MEINGYVLEGELQTTNGGNCKWGFAKKKGQRFFIKELLNPVYPADDVAISEELKRRKREACRTFEERQTLLYHTLNSCSEGILVHVEEFFRSGSKYYVTMPAISAVKEDVVKSTAVSIADRMRMCRGLIHSLARFHEAGLIHGDLKLDNVLVTRTKGGYLTAKVIDFEDCYWLKESPAPGEDIKCDMSYAAPETFRLMLGENLKLTQAVDVFALGLLMHTLLTGEFPRYDKDKFSYPFESLIKGEPLLFWESRLPDPYKRLIKKMLLIEPEKRITLRQAEEELVGHPVEYGDIEVAEAPVPSVRAGSDTGARSGMSPGAARGPARSPAPGIEPAPAPAGSASAASGPARAAGMGPASAGSASAASGSARAAAYSARPSSGRGFHMNFEPDTGEKHPAGKLKINMGSGVRVSGEGSSGSGSGPGYNSGPKPVPERDPRREYGSAPSPRRERTPERRSGGSDGFFDSAGDL